MSCRGRIVLFMIKALLPTCSDYFDLIVGLNRLSGGCVFPCFSSSFFPQTENDPSGRLEAVVRVDGGTWGPVQGVFLSLSYWH